VNIDGSGWFFITLVADSVPIFFSVEGRLSNSSGRKPKTSKHFSQICFYDANCSRASSSCYCTDLTVIHSLPIIQSPGSEELIGTMHMSEHFARESEKPSNRVIPELHV
jgi:hypothetical protein